MSYTKNPSGNGSLASSVHVASPMTHARPVIVGTIAEKFLRRRESSLFHICPNQRKKREYRNKNKIEK